MKFFLGKTKKLEILGQTHHTMVQCNKSPLSQKAGLHKKRLPTGIRPQENHHEKYNESKR